MTMLFVVEVIVKVISRGLLFNGPLSYLRKPSNVLDFFVVLISLVSALIKSGNLGMVKVLRIATRLTRPMRLIFRDERLKISIKVLQAVMPQILRLLMIYCLFCLIFATIGVNLLSGRMYYCQAENLIVEHRIQDIVITNMQDCLNLGGVWNLKYRNYDNIFNAFI